MSTDVEQAHQEVSHEAKRLPSNLTIELGELTPHNIKQLRIINQTVFPVSYNYKFYRDVLDVGDLARLAYLNDIVVGAVCCRVDTLEGGIRKLYIMTMGCLAPYRRLGIGTLMLEHVLKVCERDKDTLSLNSVYLHVQINNEGALSFYKKFGFNVVCKEENYYKRISPQDAYLLEKKLRETDSKDMVNGEIE